MYGETSFRVGVEAILEAETSFRIKFISFPPKIKLY